MKPTLWRQTAQSNIKVIYHNEIIGRFAGKNA